MSIASPPAADLDAEVAQILRITGTKIRLSEYTVASLRAEVRQVLRSAGRQAAANWAGANADFWRADRALQRHEDACGCADKIHPCNRALDLTQTWERADQECSALRTQYGLEAS